MLVRVFQRERPARARDRPIGRWCIIRVGKLGFASGSVGLSESPAIVKPRVLIPGTATSVRLDELIRRALTTAKSTIIPLTAKPGGGLTTALEYISDAFRPESRVVVPRSYADPQWSCLPANAIVVAPAGDFPVRPDKDAVYEIAGWTDDDCAEYLLAVDRARCAGIMARVSQFGDRVALGGSPRLWRIVLDEVRINDRVVTCGGSLISAYERRTHADLIPDWPQSSFLYHSARSDACAYTGEHLADVNFAKAVTDAKFFQLLVARHVLHRIAEQRSWRHGITASRGLIENVVACIRAQPEIRARAVCCWSNKLPVWCQPVLASVLVALDPNWRPPAPPRLLDRAELSGVWWNEVNLQSTKCDGARLTGANLTRADLSTAFLRSANLDRANLHKALLTGAKAEFASFVQADLSGAIAQGATFRQSDLTNADMTQADLREADFRTASLAGADFRRSNLRRAKFYGVVPVGAEFDEPPDWTREGAKDLLAGADFRDATLELAELSRIDLRGAQWQSAEFRGANLNLSNLAGIQIPGARMAHAFLRRADLTGAFFPGADLRGASLVQALMADINLERADLRGANLTGAVFHMGSSRSGLVNSPLASEGSRTGFYTDDTLTDRIAHPERVRKANLAGADLRGAVITDVDFYLVDLRGAKLDPEQEAAARACGAILESMV